jgi:hypothetical protein
MHSGILVTNLDLYSITKRTQNLQNQLLVTVLHTGETYEPSSSLRPCTERIYGVVVRVYYRRMGRSGSKYPSSGSDGLNLPDRIVRGTTCTHHSSFSTRIWYITYGTRGYALSSSYSRDHLRTLCSLTGSSLNMTATTRR